MRKTLLIPNFNFFSGSSCLFPHSSGIIEQISNATEYIQIHKYEVFAYSKSYCCRGIEENLQYPDDSVYNTCAREHKNSV